MKLYTPFQPQSYILNLLTTSGMIIFSRVCDKDKNFDLDFELDQL